MKRIIVLLPLLALGWSDTHALRAATNSVSTSRVLMIDASSMPITAGKVTLTIGALQRTNGVYAGDYKIKVAPYFYKNEKGRLAIAVSDESLTLLSHGKATTVAGTATTIGKTGRTRHIDATATPADINHGKLKLTFIAGDKKMMFEPAYHLVESGATAVPAQPPKTNFASASQSSALISHPN